MKLSSNPTPIPSQEGSQEKRALDRVPLLGGVRGGFPRKPERPRGFVIVVMLVILAILGILVVANAKRLHALSRELKIVEQRQVQRLCPELRATNTVPSTNSANLPPAATQ